jgi:hypothetical protein
LISLGRKNGRYFNLSQQRRQDPCNRYRTSAFSRVAVRPFRQSVLPSGNLAPTRVFVDIRRLTGGLLYLTYDPALPG